MMKKLIVIVSVLAVSTVLGGCTAEEIGQTFYNAGKNICEQAGNCDMRNEDKRIPPKDL